MELLYRIGPGDLLPQPTWMPSGDIVPTTTATTKSSAVAAAALHCTVSSGNLVAFSVYTGRQHGFHVPHVGHHVLVADLNTAWDVHVVVTSPTACVTSLMWHSDGWQLLVGWSDGCVQLMNSPLRLLAEWNCVQRERVSDGGAVLATLFFHGGRSVGEWAGGQGGGMPTAVQWAGRPADGWLAISDSGRLVVSCCHQENTSSVQRSVVERGAGGGAGRLISASLAHRPCGGVTLACSDGLAVSPVRCWHVCVQCDTAGAGCSFSLQIRQLPSVWLHANRDVQLVTHLLLRQLSQSAEPRLLVAAVGVDGSYLSSWQLGEAGCGPAIGCEEQLQIQCWKSVASCRVPQSGHVTSMCVSTVSTDSVQSTQWSQHTPSLLLIGCDDGHLLSLHLDTLQQQQLPSSGGTSCSYSTELSEQYLPTQPPAKLRRRHRHWFRNREKEGDGVPLPARGVCSVSVSASSRLIVLLDTGCYLHVVRLADPTLVGCSNASDQQMALLSSLECCMFNGRDLFDILLAAIALPSVFSDSVIEAWTERFQRHPPAVQQLFWRQNLVIRGWLCRMSVSLSASSGSSAASRKLAQTGAELMLHCAAAVLRRVVFSQEDLVATLLATKSLDSVCELDKMVALARDHDSAPPADLSSLSQLCELCQWVLDVCLQLFAPTPVAQLPRDRRLLQLVRELIVLVRRCGQLRASCAPRAPRLCVTSSMVTPTADSHDAPAQLFRLATRLLSVGEGEAFSEVNQLIAPSEPLPLQQLPIGALFACQRPGRLYTFYESTPANGPVSVQNSSSLEVGRHRRLGRTSTHLRHCTRCGAVSAGPVTPGSSGLLALWQRRCDDACLCGGHWSVRKQFVN